MRRVKLKAVTILVGLHNKPNFDLSSCREILPSIIERQRTRFCTPKNNICNSFCRLVQQTELSFSEKHDEISTHVSNIEAVGKGV